MTRYYEFVCDWWRLFKRYAAVTSRDDEYWRRLIADVDALAAKYNNVPFAVDCCMALVDEISRQSKGANKRFISGG